MTDITATEQQNSWFADDGMDTDVVLSTRVRLARNLSDFPFPEFIKNDSDERVRAILFDAFSRSPDADMYQTLSVRNLEQLGGMILVERGVLPPGAAENPSTGIIVRSDGRISGTVNYHDHLHLSSFVSGFDPAAACALVSSVDEELQKYVQFAGNLEFGYFTSRLRDAGTGMKTSVMIHIPSIVYQNLHHTLFKTLVESGFDIYACYAVAPVGNTKTLGAWYRLCTDSCFPLSETDQIASVTQAVRNIINVERNARKDILADRPTMAKDIVYRAIAAIKYSRYVSFREGVELVSSLKWGVSLGLIDGFSDGDLYSLLYRIQSAHLLFIARQEGLSFEKDVISNNQKADRLRSIILQEAVSQVHFLV
ncbi:MAG: hypothetical protein K5930_00390 [Treponemataceae bacterium]|nr:hypothetical protein [Treponemataceae bacterium]